MIVNRNIAIGKTPERKSSRKSGDGVNSVRSWPLTNQSKDTNGVEVEPILSAGKKISFITLGYFTLKESMAVRTCK